MLTQRLHDKELFGGDPEMDTQKHEARILLNGAVRDLITAMVSVELDGLYTREEIENFVMKRMEYYETFLYGMDAEEFDGFLDDQLIKAIKRGMR